MTDANTKTKNIGSMSFEDALGELESIVSTLESGEAKLEDSINIYERGIALKKHCESKLTEAQSKIEKITIDSDGNVATEPFEIEQ